MVTGGAKGIGRAATAAFAALGDTVVALGRDAEALAALPDSLGVHAANVRTARCDVSVEAEVEETFGEIGAVDVLVNNAGVAISAPLAKTSLADWESQIAVNATAAFLCTRAVLPGMLERDRGSVLTVASTAGKVGARNRARLLQRPADELPRARPIETHGALGRVHGLGDLEAEAPQMVAERHRRVPVDRGGMPGVHLPERIGDDMRGRIGDAVEKRHVRRPGDRSSDEAIFSRSAARIRQLE